MWQALFGQAPGNFRLIVQCQQHGVQGLAFPIEVILFIEALQFGPFGLDLVE
ncbi:hypothetical protein D3C76_1606270 [compost metagenome]